MMDAPLELPRAGDVVTANSFAHLALVARRGAGTCMVAAALDSTGACDGHLVVYPDLPDSPPARARVLARIMLYLQAAVETDWEYVAYAIVEPAGNRHAAFAVIERIERIPRGHL